MTRLPNETADTRRWQDIPKAERDAMLRAAGMRPPETDDPFPHFEAIRMRPTLRSLWDRLFGR